MEDVVSRFSELIRRLREREDLSQEKLGRVFGNVWQKSIRDWESGATPSTRNLKKVADYLDKSLDELMAYNSGESDQSVDEFLDRVSASHKKSHFTLILEWLPFLKPSEIAEIARRCFDLIYNNFRPNTPPSPSIAEMAKQANFDGFEIPSDRVEAISNGDRPTDHELVQLSLILTKPRGDSWTTHELMEIRDRDFPAFTNQPSKPEKEPNGNGV